MPELPEIEHLRRTLEPRLVGARVRAVRLRRRDIVRIAGSRKAQRGVSSRHLLEGAVIRQIIRHGKSLAILAEDGRVLAAHMGMTGSLAFINDERTTRRDRHVHCEWLLSTEQRGRGNAIMRFRDPRRFGGLWPFASMDELHSGVWSHLGPDALTIDAGTLRERLLRTRAPIKAGLLNQSLIAGVGNIYADEALFAAGIHPLARSQRLGESQWDELASAIRTIMQAAIASGGSTLRDYRDASGRPGAFVFAHRVYGRGGQPCVSCSEALRTSVVGQRTTTFCPVCQARSFRREG